MLSPLPQSTPSGQYAGRWRWWYEQLADVLLQRPDIPNKELADHFKKSVATISLIRSSDAFQTYYSQRRAAFNSAHDEILRNKMVETATLGLDVILEHIRKKRDRVPLQLLNAVVETNLDKLGYGPLAPAQQVVNVNSSGPTQVNVSLTADQLIEARAALRVAEQTQAERARLAQTEPLLLEQTPELDDVEPA